MEERNMIKIAVVEDSDKDFSVLQAYILEFFNSIDRAFSIERFPDALVFLENYHADYDIVFMDIELPNKNGMEAAKRMRQLDEHTLLIFVTNMAQYAVNGYEVNAFDFIVKPVRYSVFVTKMRRTLGYLARMEDREVLVKTEEGMARLSASQIEYIEAKAHILIYHLEGGKTILSRDTLKNVEEKLNPDTGFFRCSRCYLINLKHIREVKTTSVKVGDDELFISRPRKKEFMATVAKFFRGGN